MKSVVVEGQKVDGVLTKVVRLLAPDRPPIPVTVTIGDDKASNISYIRGEPVTMNVVIPREEFEKFYSSNPEPKGYKLAMRRSLYHETGHLLFTDGSIHSVDSNLLNALEDGRIERLTGEKFKGTREYFEYLQKTHYLRRIKSRPQDLSNPYFIALAGSQLDVDRIKRKIRKMIPPKLMRFFEAGEEARNASSTAEVEEIVKRLVGDEKFTNVPTMTIKLPKRDNEDGNDDSEEQEGGEDDTESDRDDEDTGRGEADDDDGATDGKGPADSEAPEEGDDVDGDSDASDGPTDDDEDESGSESDELTSDAVEALIDALGEDVKGLEKQVSKALNRNDIIDITEEEFRQKVKKFQEILPEHAYRVDIMTNPHVEDTSDPTAVAQIQEKMNQLRFESKKKNPSRGGYRFNLMRYAQGDEKVFLSGRRDIRGGVAVCVLIDASSSMTGHSIHTVMRCLDTMSEAFKGTDIVWSAVTYRTERFHGLTIDILKDWDDDKLSGPVSTSGLTPTGPGVEIATAMLDARDEPVKALILLSDGEANTEWPDINMMGTYEQMVQNRLRVCLDKNYFISLVGIQSPIEYDPLGGRATKTINDVDELVELFTMLTNEILDKQGR